jgi:hypothetical protein
MNFQGLSGPQSAFNELYLSLDEPAAMYPDVRCDHGAPAEVPRLSDVHRGDVPQGARPPR